VGSRLLHDLPANARAVPSPLEATLTDVAKGAQLALAVNGKVAAVAQAYQDATGPVRVSFLVPEEAFKTGENEVQVFGVNGPASNPILVSLQTSLSD
jgi:hypothetical protein